MDLETERNSETATAAASKRSAVIRPLGVPLPAEGIENLKVGASRAGHAREASRNGQKMVPRVLGQRFGVAFVRVESPQGWLADVSWADTRGGPAEEVGLRFAAAFAKSLAEARSARCGQGTPPTRQRWLKKEAGLTLRLR